MTILFLSMCFVLRLSLAPRPVGESFGKMHLCACQDICESRASFSVENIVLNQRVIRCPLHGRAAGTAKYDFESILSGNSFRLGIVIDVY